MMKKSMPWRGMTIVVFSFCALALPAMATLDDGTTYQCWSFVDPGNPVLQYGIMPEEDTLDNDFAVPGGGPVAMIQNLSVNTDVAWTNNYGRGAWLGEEFKIILDIPNQPLDNHHKNLTLTMRYKGEYTFMGVTGIHLDNSIGLFEPQGVPTIETEVDDFGEWNVLTQEFYIEPNPMEEIVVIGVQGIESLPGTATPLAIVDWICVETACVPEPSTISILAIAAGILSRIKHKRN